MPLRAKIAVLLLRVEHSSRTLRCYQNEDESHAGGKYVNHSRQGTVAFSASYLSVLQGFCKAAQSLSILYTSLHKVTEL